MKRRIVTLLVIVLIALLLALLFFFLQAGNIKVSHAYGSVTTSLDAIIMALCAVAISR